jgi:transposase-like protein
MATTTTTTRKAVQPRRSFSAQQKTRAVLEVWTESRKPAAIARELEITTTQLDQWQQRAMKALLAALEPREGDPGKEATLSARVERMMRRQARRGPGSRLAQRLGAVQDAVKAAPARRRTAAGKAPPPATVNQEQ